MLKVMRRAVAVMLLIGAACTGGRSSPETSGSSPPSTGGPRPAASPAPSVSAQASPAKTLVWAAVEGKDQVVQVDVRTRAVIARHEVAGGPHNITVAPDGTVAVALPQAGRIALVRKSSVRTISLGGSPHDVKITGDLVVVANEGEARLDLVTVRGRIVGRVGLKADPHDLAISPDGRFAWVSLDGLGDLAVVDLGARRVMRYVATAHRPHDLLFGPDGRLWVTDWNEGVYVYTASGRPLERILGDDDHAAGVQVHHLAFTPDGREAWLTDHADGRIYVADARKLRVLDWFPIAGAPHHVTITPDGRWAVVANHDDGVVVIFAVANRRRVASVPVGAGPHGVWAVP